VIRPDARSVLRSMGAQASFKRLESAPPNVLMDCVTLTPD
jgi:hypothetical protein